MDFSAFALVDTNSLEAHVFWLRVAQLHLSGLAPPVHVQLAKFKLVQLAELLKTAMPMLTGTEFSASATLVSTS